MQRTLKITPASDEDVGPIIALWDECGLIRSWNDPEKDIGFARQSGESDVLVGHLEGELVASVMVGHDGHRGVVYYVCVSPDICAKGFGRQIMAAAESWLEDRGVWKMNLMIREGNEKVQAFYEALGYGVEARTCMSKKLGEQG